MTTKSQDTTNKPQATSLANHVGHPTLDKWKSAFDSKGGFTHNAVTKQVVAPVVMMEDFEEGFLNVNRMLVGTKIIFHKVCKAFIFEFLIFFLVKCFSTQVFSNVFFKGLSKHEIISQIFLIHF